MLRERHPFVPGGEQDVVALLPAGTRSDALLTRLATDVWRARQDLAGTDNLQGGSGGALGVFLELGSEFLKTSAHRRYPTAETALECEWDRELLREQLGIYHPGRTWFLSRGADAAFWACSLTPTLPLLRDRFNQPDARCVDEAWILYLEAFRMSFDLACRQSVLLDCNPNNFGIAGDRLYYVDDDVATRNGRVPFGHQALLRLREYEHTDVRGRARFLEGFAGLVEHFADDERLRLELIEDLEPTLSWPREPELRARIEAILGCLEEGRSRGG